MKLTTATLKKLIREELNRMNEMDQQNPQHKDIFMIIVNAAKEEGLEEAKAGMLAKAASAEIVKSKAGKVSGYAINTKKQR